jgi:ketosteroid isomerase-like protein
VVVGGQQLLRSLTTGEYSTFDKQADRFSQNNKPIAKLSELKGIRLQHYSRLNKGGKPFFHRYYIYLLMPDGKQTELDNYPDPAFAE